MIKANILKCFNIVYSKSLKRIFGVPAYTSSHITVSNSNDLLLKHYTIALTQAGYIKKIIKVQNLLTVNDIPI